MRAVAAGEADDHEGWECGELCEYDSPVAAKAGAAQAEEVEDGEAPAEAEEVEPSESAEATAAAEAPPALQTNKLLFSIGLPMLANQILKRADKESPSFLPTLRTIYGSSVLAHIGVQLLAQWRIGAANDTSLVEKPADPMSMLFGSGGDAPQQTAREYDLSQLKSLRTSFQMGVVITLVLHLKFGMTQPLVYQAVSQLVELFFHPLVQVHLVGKPTTGALKRPFGSVKPDMSGLMKGLGLPTPPTAAAPQPATAES